MPPKRGLDGAMTQRLETLLHARYATLSEQVRRLRQATTVIDRSGADPSDLAVAGCQNELDAARLDRLSAQLVALNAAIARLQHREYGICDDCGDFIGLGRLEALPFARRCRRCQADAEATTSRETPLARVASPARSD